MDLYIVLRVGLVQLFSYQTVYIFGISGHTNSYIVSTAFKFPYLNGKNNLICLVENLNIFISLPFQPKTCKTLLKLLLSITCIHSSGKKYGSKQGCSQAWTEVNGVHTLLCIHTSVTLKMSGVHPLLIESTHFFFRTTLLVVREWMLW